MNIPQSCILVVAIVLGACEQAIANKIAAHGPLTAHTEDGFTCGKQVQIRVEAPTADAFTSLEERSKLEKLLGSVRAGLSFECAEAETVSVLGVVQGKAVYRGVASAAESWVLRDLQSQQASLPDQGTLSRAKNPTSVNSGAIIPNASQSIESGTVPSESSLVSKIEKEPAPATQLKDAEVSGPPKVIEAPSNISASESPIGPVLERKGEHSKDKSLSAEAPKQPVNLELGPVSNFVPKDERSMQVSDRVRLFGPKGEGALTPLLVRAFGYRAVLLESCKKIDGKKEVVRDLTAFLMRHLPEALPSALHGIDTYVAQKHIAIPACESREYKVALSWNEKELKGQLHASLDLIYGTGKRVLFGKTILKKLKLYEGEIDGTPTREFFRAFGEFISRGHLGPGAYQYQLFEETVFRESALVVLSWASETVNYWSSNSIGLERFINAVAQDRLGWMGYYRGPINGVLTEETLQAVQKYQHDHPDLPKNEDIIFVHMDPNFGQRKWITPLILYTLGSVRESPKYMKMLEAQLALMRLGWFKHSISGVENAETVRAVTFFKICRSSLGREIKESVVSTLRTKGEVSRQFLSDLGDEGKVVQQVIGQASVDDSMIDQLLQDLRKALSDVAEMKNATVRVQPGVQSVCQYY